jgi:Gpi18-like mannosyltransferase
MNNNKKFLKKFIILASIIWLAIIVRIPGLPFTSGDYNAFISRWYDTIKNNGGFSALKNAMGDYTQPYLYLLALGTYTNINKLFYVKMITLVFEIMAAFFAMKIVNMKYKNEKFGYLAFGSLLFIPTVIFNGSVWGQCDIIYTSFAIGSIYYILCKKPITSMIFYGIALSFKLQAIFLLPLFGVLLFKNRIKIYHFVIIPLSYVVLSIPSLIVGRSLTDMLLTYANQSGEYKNLTYNAPSIYQWFTSKFFSDTNLIGYIGILLTFVIVLIILYISVRYIKVIKYENIVELALLFSIIIPFLLPRMHERYFFMADVISLLYAFSFPGKFYIAIILPLISLFSYFPFLYHTSANSIFSLSIILFLVIVDLIYTFRIHLKTQ